MIERKKDNSNKESFEEEEEKEEEEKKDDIKIKEKLEIEEEKKDHKKLKIKEEEEEEDEDSDKNSRKSDPIIHPKKFKDEFPKKKKLIPKKNYETFVKQPFWLDANLFEIIQTSSEEKKVKSIYTILSIWNTMMGSTLISMPYFISQAGIIPSIIILFIYGLISFYTARIVVKTGGKDNDYADTVYRYFGKGGNIGKVLQIIFNLSINIGATFIYFVIINQNLFPCIAVLLNKLFNFNINSEDLTPDFSKFSIIYCGIAIGVLIFPLLIRKEMGFLVRINSFGIYFVLFLIIFVLYIGIKGLITTKYKFDYMKNIADTEPRYLYLYGPNPSKLAGGACLGLFAHSVILPLLKNNEKQENNKRDLLIGYLLVIFTYLAVGILGYIGFSAKNFDGNFKDNWFRFFAGDDTFILFLRALNVFQLLSIFPILCYVIRIQFFGIFFEDNFPSYLHIIIFSLILIILCFLILYFLYESLSSLISYIGAGTGLFLIFIIPIVVNIVYYKRKHPHNLTELQAHLIFKNDEEKDLNQLLKNDISDIDYFGISKKPKNKIKEILFYTSQILIMIFGVFTFFIQFVNINFFNIKIKPD